jgi:hypothetical protein
MIPTVQRIDENSPLSATNIHLEEIIRVPIERQVEFREFKQTDDQIISMVRCLYFAKTYLNSSKLNQQKTSLKIRFVFFLKLMIELDRCGLVQMVDMFMFILLLVWSLNQ